MSTHTRNRAPRPELISVREAAELLNVHPRTPCRWIQRGHVRAHRIDAGRELLRLDRRDVEDLVRRVRPEEVAG